ncbi:unnamed protein product [Protopolystoma xenopodis]|uniref:Uncharacterized protein n=1 Tax=Protopolystoma xenopodis TaxID=117903 RepID=A0A3S4ZX83_9PLAT|nr:unnamed protein product [Protopolystoma xenopodis]
MIKPGTSVLANSQKSHAAICSKPETNSDTDEVSSTEDLLLSCDDAEKDEGTFLDEAEYKDSDVIDNRTIVFRIRDAVHQAHGSLGLGILARFRVVHWSPSSGLLIVRCLRHVEIVRQLISALTLITEFKSRSLFN